VEEDKGWYWYGGAVEFGLCCYTNVRFAYVNLPAVEEPFGIVEAVASAAVLLEMSSRRDFKDCFALQLIEVCG
jgi:hypothetical protein